MHAKYNKVDIRKKPNNHQILGNSLIRYKVELNPHYESISYKNIDTDKI